MTMEFKSYLQWPKCVAAQTCLVRIAECNFLQVSVQPSKKVALFLVLSCSVSEMSFLLPSLIDCCEESNFWNVVVIGQQSFYV